jgi:plastocyanin
MRSLTLSSLIVLAFLAVPAAAGGPPVVKVDDDFFEPERVAVQKGGKVVWKWKGEDTHNVALWKPGRSLSKEPTKRSGVKTSGKFSYRLRSVGRWRVICEIHPNSMRMKVRVKEGQARRS